MGTLSKNDPSSNFHSICDIVLAQHGWGFGERVRQVVENPPGSRGHPEDGRKQPAHPTANIDNGRVVLERVGGHQVIHRHLSRIGHGTVEDFIEFGLPNEVVEGFHAAVQGRNNRVAGSDRIRQMAPMLAMLDANPPSGP